jgi:hypothetical protein
MLRHCAWIFVVFLAASAFAQTSTDQPRMFLPKDTFYGWAEFDFAPPHNEIDPNLCRGNASQYGGSNAPCNLFVRWEAQGRVEAWPFGKGIFRRIFFSWDPKFYFGKNVPQALYTYSFDAIGLENEWGGGVALPKGFEARLTQHFLFTRLGGRAQDLGAAYLGNNGPYGRYFDIGVRKYFGHRRMN